LDSQKSNVSKIRSPLFDPVLRMAKKQRLAETIENRSFVDGITHSAQCLGGARVFEAGGDAQAAKALGRALRKRH